MGALVCTADKMRRHQYTASLLLTVVASLTSAAPTGGPLEQIQWNETAPGANPLLQYGTLEVPMDWTNPNGEHITLDITRLKTNSSSKIGSLFLNPGGPGGRAGPLCEEQAEGYSIFSAALVESFDLICPDPRGVGASSQISCDPDLWSQTPSYYVDDEASFQAVLEFNKKLGADCLQRSGPVLGFVDTTNAAKDLEAIRLALGEDKFDYLGFSYGTQLGAAYAELFPDKIRTMTLDGDVDHSMDELDGFVMSNWAMEDELNRFFAWCNKNETCAFHSDRDAAEVWDEMIASANKNPIPAPGCSKSADTASAGTCRGQVTGYNIIFNLENHFQDPARWADLKVHQPDHPRERHILFEPPGRPQRPRLSESRHRLSRLGFQLNDVRRACGPTKSRRGHVPSLSGEQYVAAILHHVYWMAVPCHESSTSPESGKDGPGASDPARQFGS